MNEIKTLSGAALNVEAPDPAAIHIRDIAHALSLICRATGQVTGFFSVAGHCINCAKEALARGESEETALACLLHDATESYMSDLATPVKRLFPEYEKYERRLLDCIYRKYLGHDVSGEMWAAVREIDETMKSHDLQNLVGIKCPGELPELHIELDYGFRGFEAAEKEYLELFERLSRKD